MRGSGTISHFGKLGRLGKMILKRPNCVGCMKPYDGHSRGQKYCSHECRLLHTGITSSKVLVGISNATRGALKELIVCTDLLSKGYSVFRSVSPASPFDLVAFKDGEVLKIEVTSGYRSPKGNINYPKHENHKSKFNQIAVVFSDMSIIYIPELT